MKCMNFLWSNAAFSVGDNETIAIKRLRAIGTEPNEASPGFKIKALIWSRTLAYDKGQQNLRNINTHNKQILKNKSAHHSRMDATGNLINLSWLSS